MFGDLLAVCVNDEYRQEKRILAEGVLLVLLGGASSFLTAYALAALGILL